MVSLSREGNRDRNGISQSSRTHHSIYEYSNRQFDVLGSLKILISSMHVLGRDGSAPSHGVGAYGLHRVAQETSNSEAVRIIMIREVF